MRTLYSYMRLVLACWLFMGGMALQFVPSAASVSREAHWRERQLKAVPADKHAQWIIDQDNEDSRTEAYVRLFGVLLGGSGLAAALAEGAFLMAQFNQRRPPSSDRASSTL